MASNETRSSSPGSSPAPNTRDISSWMTERIVFITVDTGPNKKRFSVHEKLITANSPFFDDYFNSVSQGEDPPELLRLPDVDVNHFAKFMNWLYATSWLDGTVRARTFRFPRPGSAESGGMSVRDYLAMYVMGYRFQMHALRNAIVDVLYDYYSQPALEPPAVAINMEDVKFIFDQTPNDSPMRRYLVCQLLFYFFDGKRAGKPLPKEWATVLGEANDISFSMFRMLNDWGWSFNNQVPAMVIKTRNYFYDEASKVIKIEEGEGAAGGFGAMQAPRRDGSGSGGQGQAPQRVVLDA